jgi:hypothetical protein
MPAVPVDPGDERAIAILRRSQGRCGNGQTYLLGGADDEVDFGPFLERHRDYQGDEPPPPAAPAPVLPLVPRAPAGAAR